MNASPHKPVMLAEMLAALAPRDGASYVDGTFGAGGYSRAILDSADCSVCAVDRDDDVVADGREMERAYRGRFTLLCGRFGDMLSLLRHHGIEQVDGVVLDLGVSSMQLDQPQRGFSFRFDGPLDMRMSRSGTSAADVVNGFEERALAEIIRDLGEERFARRVARAIVEARSLAPITRTEQLADIVRRAVPRAKDGLDPATRTFMALRLHVNDELGEIGRGLQAAEEMLVAGGRLVVITFHSLEDRVVKRFMQSRSRSTHGVSRHAPQPGDMPLPSFKLTHRRALAPGEAEIRSNPRARSARLRTAERTENPAWPPQPERIAA
ncbi:MAG: 16S rRNA (cytosine(1402)-N(4))-methyltransferase RsmH [Alphaproteobacteria bacterium]|nr:16S rRNA (cytosine(1402)-N(4))-methyltransferase RsmH [Alphaproteobacteria bacterium]